MRQMLGEAAGRFAQWLLGGTCLLCRGSAERDVLCCACDAELPRLRGPLCPRCALPSPAGEICGRCLATPPHFDATIAALEYAFPVDVLVQSLKFLWLARSETFELRAAGLLLSGRMRRHFLAYLGLLIGAGIVLPLATSAWKALVRWRVACSPRSTPPTSSMASSSPMTARDCDTACWRRGRPSPASAIRWWCSCIRPVAWAATTKSNWNVPR